METHFRPTPNTTEAVLLSSHKYTSPGQVSVLAHNYTARDSREETTLRGRTLVPCLNTGTPERYPRAEAHLIFFTRFFVSISPITQQTSWPSRNGAVSCSRRATRTKAPSADTGRTSVLWVVQEIFEGVNSGGGGGLWGSLFRSAPGSGL